MKIGVVSNLYPPMARGGAEQVANRVVRELHQRGHDVFVFSSMPFDGPRSLFTERLTARHAEDVYRLYPLNVYHLLNDNTFPFPLRALWHFVDMYAPFSGYALDRIIEREQPDVILTHNLKGLGLQVVPAIRRSGVQHIHTLHDVQLSVPSGLLIAGEEDAWLNRSRLRRWYEHQVQRIVGSPETVLSPSKFLADFYHDRGFFPESTVQVLPNPAPDLRPAPHATRETEEVHILFAGQVEVHKGIKFLLESLDRTDLSFRLHVAGEGSLSGYVNDWARRDSRVIYHGFVSLKHLFDLFAISDVCVVPSLCYENSPTIIYESFQAGVPVIASDIGGVGELIDHEKTGFLFEPGNEEAFISTLKRFVAHRESFSKAREEIKKSVQPHAIRKYVDTLESLFRS